MVIQKCVYAVTLYNGQMLSKQKTRHGSMAQILSTKSFLVIVLDVLGIRIGRKQLSINCQFLKRKLTCRVNSRYFQSLLLRITAADYVKKMWLSQGLQIYLSGWIQGYRKKTLQELIDDAIEENSENKTRQRPSKNYKKLSRDEKIYFGHCKTEASSATPGQTKICYNRNGQGHIAILCTMKRRERHLNNQRLQTHTKVYVIEKLYWIYNTDTQGWVIKLEGKSTDLNNKRKDFFCLKKKKKKLEIK
jgi:hypothetical protein